MSLLTGGRELRLLRGAARIPAAVWGPLGRLACFILAITRPRPLRQWERNAAIATGREPGFRQRQRAQWSWLRNTIGSLQLGTWSAARIQRTVLMTPEDLARLQLLRRTTGLVIATPHMGSWDLAGAFGCVNDLPVTSVAERLPAGQFEYFSAMRARLGMRILPHGGADIIPTLCSDVRAGRVVCLVADRDFSGRGLPVVWPNPNGGRRLTLPAGPVLVAQQTGATLVGLACEFVGRKMRITVGDAIATADGREGAEQMAQELVDYFAAQVQAKPTDWHMMQRFFPGEVV